MGVGAFSEEMKKRMSEFFFLRRRSTSPLLPTPPPPPKKKKKGNSHHGPRVHRAAPAVREHDLDQRLRGHRGPALLDEPEAVVVVDRVGRQREAVDAHLRGRGDLGEDGRLAVPVPERLGRVEEEEVVADRVVLGCREVTGGGERVERAKTK